MELTLVAFRTVLYGAGFLWLWAWVAQLLRPVDGVLGGQLAEWVSSAGWVALAIGALIVISCAATFVVRGRGTPAPFDPPLRLVSRGPYQYVRNPMYFGGALLLLGFGLLSRSPSIVLFVPAWWLLFHVFVIAYEEHALHDKFGAEYDEYCRRTPRWIPRMTHR